MKTILLIEDDQVVRTVYQRFLQSHGFAVELAVNGEEGLAKMARCTPDAVVLDVMMPKVDGISVIYAIRVQENLHKLPVLVLTNAAIPTFIEQALQAGANYVFDKGKDSPLAVVQMIQTLIQSTRAA